MSFPNDLKNFESMASMKNMLGVSLLDLLKPNIKTKDNENVIKMLDVVKDKPDAYIELLSVAIFHKNLEIIKLIIEKYITAEIDVPYLNALTFFNSIIPDDAKYKLTDSKNNYIDIICPFVLMAGIGGDIKIFEYLLNNHLISDLKITGTIGLSKRYKNAFTSNIVGACAYYGNDKLLEYLLKNYRSELDINIISTEKKSKNTKIHISKEFSGASPTLLACAAPISDEKTIKILKILEDYTANFEGKDFNDNNIIHITVRAKKIQTLKFLINSLELKDIMNDTNNDNITPFGIAQQMKNQEMISFFNSLGKIDENQIEKNLQELIEDSNRKANRNKKKGKKNKKNELPLLLLNSSEYQETLEVNKNKEDKEEYNNNDENLEEEKEEEKEEENEEDDINDENKEENEKNDNDEKKYNKNNFKKNKNDYNHSHNDNYSKNYKYKSNYDYYNNYNNYDNYNNNYDNYNNYNNYNTDKYNNNNYNSNYNNNNYNNNYNNYNNNYKNNNYNNNYKYNTYDNNYKYNNYDNNNNYYKKKSSGIYKNTNQKGYYNNSTNSNYYTRNQNNYNKKNSDNNNNNQPYNNNNNQSKEIEYNNNINNNNKEETKEISQNSNNIINNDNKEEENSLDNSKKEPKKENMEEENEDEGSYSEESFLSDKDHNSKSENQKEEYKSLNNSEYNELYKKYLDLERKCYNLEKEKNEISMHIKKMYMGTKTNLKNIPNKEENINSIINLVNKELKDKDIIINELKKNSVMADLSNIKSFSEEKLNEYKKFYTNNLIIINDALNGYFK